MKNFYDKLATVIPAETILLEEPMKKHTTFRIGGNADMFVSPEIEKIPDIVALAKESHVPVTVVGNGSNLLVGDKGIRGLVLSISKGADKVVLQPAGAELVACESNKVRIQAEAGALLSKVAAEAARNSLTGFECMSGIPGTLGGAIFMNAGAYGGEMSQVVSEVTAVDQNGEVKVFKKDELFFGYRKSVFTNNNINITN